VVSLTSSFVGQIRWIAPPMAPHMHAAAGQPHAAPGRRLSSGMASDGPPANVSEPDMVPSSNDTDQETAFRQQRALIWVKHPSREIIVVTWRPRLIS
jgi:hypothetical protein